MPIFGKIQILNKPEKPEPPKVVKVKKVVKVENTDKPVKKKWHHLLEGNTMLKVGRSEWMLDMILQGKNA